MNKKNDNSLVIDCLKAKYGIEVINLISLSLGADMHASVYQAETRDKSYFVKLKYGHYSDISVMLLAFLQASGVQQVIPSIKTIEGKLTQQINGFTLIVYPFFHGQNGFYCHLTDDQWIILGKALKQVHQLDIPSSIKDQIRKETYSSKSRETVRSLIVHVDEDDLSGDETSLQLKAFMKEHKSIIHHMVNRAEALSKVIQEQSPEFVLCHSDIHAGNILINESGSIYIVDWDDPIMSPKERDLMFIGGGVANVWNNPPEEEFFYKGYGKTTINREILAYYRHERIVKDIAEYGQALILSIDGGKERMEMFEQFKAMFEPNGVIDIACKTDIYPQARLISSKKEKKTALDFRQQHFFDRLKMQDPYAWALDQKNHLHWLLYDGDEVIGYAHVQIWSNHRAALRIVVVDEQRRKQGLGKYLMDHCEQELKQRGIALLQTEASPNAYLFYKKLGYIEMPFNNPEGEPTHQNDRAMGKYL